MRLARNADGPASPSWRQAGPTALLLALAACNGPGSALVEAGRDAQRLAQLWWWMAGGAALVWTAVVALAVYAVRAPPGRHGRRQADLLILWGGAVFPTVVLAVLLVIGLRMMPVLAEPGAADGIRLEVSGEQWWWRVRYHLPGEPPFETANEVVLPVGERVEVTVTSPDVIHSLWVPSLAGKIDMIPGRVNRIALEPLRVGVYRGVCAEYCGASHALMAFEVVVVAEDEFRAWARAQAAPAAAPAGALAARGAGAFLANGCGACHAVRGTLADGVVGPDLTHVGSRRTLAAGTIPNDEDAFLRWIARPDSVKPGALMPSFGMLPADELRALAAWLDGLR